MRVVSRFGLLFSLVVPALGLSAAHANPASTATSAGDLPAQAFIEYAYEIDSSTITRERVGEPGASADDGIPRHRDLEFHQFKHTLTPRVEIGVVRDAWLSVALPITIAQARELELADGVTRDSSSTLQSGYLPAGGFDARDPSVGPSGNLVFRGVSRSGIDQIHLGLNVAPMNQAHDDTKPTWKLGAELRLAIGGIMAFSANNPTSNTAVGRGVHELRLWTSIDRKFSWTEGYFGLYYQVPLTTRESSLYTEDLGFGVTNARAPQEGGMTFGLETFLLDDKVTGNRISLDLGGRVEGHFEGREYSELWEVFAFAGDSGNTAIAPQLVLDRDPTTPGQQDLNHPGITNTENYLVTAGSAAVRASLGPHVRFAATVDVAWKTDHVITFADAGVDFPQCTTKIECEPGENDVVNPGTGEVNPLHNQKIDLVGHRYHSENNLGVIIGVQGQFLF